MTGRHESPPVGSAAREATAPPYIGRHRWGKLRQSVETMRGNCEAGSGTEFGLSLVLDEMKTIELAEDDPRTWPVVESPGAACYHCGKNVSRFRGFYVLLRVPGDEPRHFCSVECLHWQLHEDEKL